jgi:phosphohistidine phosphatase
MAAHLRRAHVAPDLVLCSTAARTRETWQRIAPALDSGVPVRFERPLYGASADSLLRLLRIVDDRVASVMVIAHSSGIEDLALLLAGSGERLADVREKFPTGALATLRFGGPWRDLRAGAAELVAFVTPRELADG